MEKHVFCMFPENRAGPISRQKEVADFQYHLILGLRNCNDWRGGHDMLLNLSNTKIFGTRFQYNMLFLWKNIYLYKPDRSLN